MCLCIYQLSIYLLIFHLFLYLSLYLHIIYSSPIYLCINIYTYVCTYPFSSVSVPIFRFYLHTRFSALHTLAPCFLRFAHLRDLLHEHFKIYFGLFFDDGIVFITGVFSNAFRISLVLISLCSIMYIICARTCASTHTHNLDTAHVKK